MIERYGQGDDLCAQAQQVWLILSAHAVFCRDRQRDGLRAGLLAYSDLAELMGKRPEAAISLSDPLGIVERYCASRGLPLLNMIVVSKRTGEPGSGARSGVAPNPGRSVQEDQQKVLNYSWFELRPPRIEALRSVWRQDG